MRPSFLRRLRIAVSTTLAIALVLLAVGISLARVLIVYAPDFRAELENAVSQVLQRPITLGGLRARWTGRHPKLILQDVRLAGSGPAAGLQVDELEVSIDLLASLRERQLRPAELTLGGLRLTVLYGEDGSLKLTRIGDGQLPDLEPGEGPLPALPAQVHLRAATVELVDAVSGRSHRFPQVDLWLRNDGSDYSLAGHLDLPPGLGRSARFRAEWTGLTAPEGIDGRLYVDVRELNLETGSALLQRVVNLPPLRGEAEGELWFDVRAGALAQIAGRLDASNVRTPATEAGHRWQTLAGRLGGRFLWQREEAGWRLQADEIQYISDHRVWPKNHLSLRLTEQGAQRRLQGETGYLRLNDLAPVLAALPLLPEPARQRLRALSPVGEVRAPRWTLAWSQGQLSEYALKADFTGLGIRADGKIPGVSGLDGRLSAHQGGGSLELESHRSALDFQGLFREPIPVRSLRAQLGWQIDDGGWRLEAPLIKLENEDARALARLRLFADGRGLPIIDLRAHVSDGNAAMTSRYLPAGIIGKDLLHWLDTAIRGGEIPQAEVMLFGRLDRFPYDDGSGIFDVQADVAHGQLDYQPGWPGIQEITGRLRFFANTMDIRAEHGLIQGARIEKAQVGLADFSGADLRIDGQVRGEGRQLLGFLRESPLGAGIREELSGMQLSGVHDLSLQARIPVHSQRHDTKVSGILRLREGDFSAPGWGLSLENLQGPVRFTEKGVSAPAVSGRFRGQRISLAAETGFVGGSERIRLSTRLRASPQTLLGVAELPGISGAADWNLEVLLPAFQTQAKVPPLVLRVESDLRGLSVELPAPLGKPATEPRLLELQARAGRGGLEPVEISYGHDLQARLLLGEERLPQRVALEFGRGAPRLPEKRGIAISGQLGVLDLDAWRRRLRTLQSEPAAAPAAKAGQFEPLPLLGLQLQADRLRLLGQEFSQAGLSLSRIPLAWRVAFSGPDLDGEITLPDDPAATAKVKLARLRLGGGGSGGRARASAAPPPPAETIPAMDVEVADLLVEANSLGRLEFALRPSVEGMVLEKGRLSGPVLEATAQGAWSEAPAQTQLAVKFASVNAGRALGLFGYGEALSGGVAEGTLSLSWPGGPEAFDLARLGGKLDLTVMNGRMLSVEPGAGRLFGLLSLTELPRRLSLNFSDLFGEGFAFDRIEAHLRMEEGNAYTRQFYMDGPAARVDLEGRIGLGSRDYDQKVTVTPQVSTTLPAIGALTGGPAGAAVMFLTQKLLEKQLNKLTRFSYRVTGAWEEPQIEPLNQEPPKEPLEGSPVT